jgi:MYXO-CTERM domain-containing protein
LREVLSSIDNKREDPMTTTSKIAAVLGAATVSLSAVPALAQNSADPTATTTTTYPAPQQNNDDDHGKWGLLGLLGLAGLLGLKRRDRDRDDNRRTTAGTGTSNRP